MRFMKELEGPEQWYFTSLERLVKSGINRGEAKRILKEGYCIMVNDPLTGVYNRRMLFKKMGTEIKLAKEKRPLSVIMIDIDHFKKYNDTYGHIQGDLALKQTTNAIKKGTKYTDVLARYGGEEFTVILLKTDLKEARIVADRIRKNIEEMIIEASSENLPEDFEKITLSQGIAQYRENIHGKNIQQLLMDADSALYEAKKKRNSICVY